MQFGKAEVLMSKEKTDTSSRRPSGLEENLKKALTELLILFLFNEQEHYIGELSPLLEQRSHGTLSIVFPYAAIYRITKAGYLIETKKRNAPDGRLRQYYKITESGQTYLSELLSTYHSFFQGVNAILSGEGAR
jgi:PadR family transcriptional regulator, regulatory protein PadR